MCVNTNKHARVYYFPNDLTHILFSVSCYWQVKHDSIGLVIVCSIPNSICEFRRLHGVCGAEYNGYQVLWSYASWAVLSNGSHDLASKGELHFASCLALPYQSINLPSFLSLFDYSFIIDLFLLHAHMQAARLSTIHHQLIDCLIGVFSCLPNLTSNFNHVPDLCNQFFSLFC